MKIRNNLLFEEAWLECYCYRFPDIFQIISLLSNRICAFIFVNFSSSCYSCEYGLLSETKRRTNTNIDRRPGVSIAENTENTANAVVVKVCGRN